MRDLTRTKQLFINFKTKTRIRDCNHGDLLKHQTRDLHQTTKESKQPTLVFQLAKHLQQFLSLSTTETKVDLQQKKGKALPQFVKEFEVPEPRYGINVEIFLNKIGKDCGKYADKFKSWDELMTFRRRELKKLEIPVKQRRWIRKWVEKYRRGIEPYAIKMKSIAKRNKEKKKEQVDAFKAIIKPRREATKVYRQKTAPLRLERKKIMKKITRLVKTIQKRERMERRQQLAAKKQEEQKQAEAKATV
mmetsp:Transcript_24935/g.34912  ORF Transcript_24935/g.34912 Transcript_24935/m.34912 type:complete len:247 (-) Transcript_24935:62-802(-)